MITIYFWLFVGMIDWIINLFVTLPEKTDWIFEGFALIVIEIHEF